jgi:fumarate hydratase class II
MNANEVIARLGSLQSGVALHPNDDVNYGQSSNDVIPSSIHVAVLLSLVDRLFPVIEQLVHRLDELKQQYESVVKTGRTHLMDAMPLVLGDEFATWQTQISESRERLVASMPRLAEIPLGGTAIGTGINRHSDFPSCAAHHLAQQTLLPIRASSCPASRMSAQDPALEMHGQIKVLATAVMKIANDLRWMNSGPNCGLGEIQLKALQPGSSIMPGKVNPVICESVLMMCTEVLGNDTMLTVANQSGNFQLNVMLPLIADKLLTSIELMSAALNAFTNKALVDFKVNHHKLRQQQDHNPILATALNPLIGYERAADIAKTAQAQSRSVLDVALEKTHLSEEELRNLLDPMTLARPHKP